MDFDDKVLRCLHKNAESRGSNDQQNEMTARIFVAGILGGIAMHRRDIGPLSISGTRVGPNPTREQQRELCDIWPRSMRAIPPALSSITRPEDRLLLAVWLLAQTRLVRLGSTGQLHVYSDCGLSMRWPHRRVSPAED